jgi:hypothetical protein
MQSKKYRLYIDESGTHNYSQSEKIDKRYLALVGVIISEEENLNVIKPKVLTIKQMLADDLDELPVLHREDIIAKKGCFRKMEDSEIKSKYDELLIDLIESPNYIVCCVVLDKKAHLNRYGETAYHPYHYCLNVLLERYTFFLEENNSKGDVMAETRGKNEDNELREAYRTFYNDGTYFRSKYSVQARLSSSEIKMKSKTAGVEGIELADLLSLASKLDTLHSHGQLPELSDNFCKRIIDKIQIKYRKDQNGIKINGFGRKLIK